MSKLWGKTEDDFLEDTNETIGKAVANISMEDAKMNDNKIYEVPAKIDNNNEIDHPSHYADDQFECIDVMMDTQGLDATQDFCILNAFKYLYRHRKKGGIKDLKKADWYLQYAIDLEDKR